MEKLIFKQSPGTTAFVFAFAVRSVKYDIVCVYRISCAYYIVTYVRDPDQIRGSHSLSFLPYSAALAVLVLCAYCTSVSVQTANRIGVSSVGLSLVVRSGVWSSL